jgi:hypothetical protein
MQLSIIQVAFLHTEQQHTKAPNTSAKANTKGMIVQKKEYEIPSQFGNRYAGK